MSPLIVEFKDTDTGLTDQLMLLDGDSVEVAPGPTGWGSLRADSTFVVITPRTAEAFRRLEAEDRLRREASRGLRSWLRWLFTGRGAHA